MRNFDETLRDFGIENLKPKIDLHLDSSGNIAVTLDRELQIGNKTTNGLFRFVERWRKNEATIELLFERMVISFDNAKREHERSLTNLTLNPSIYQDQLENALEQEAIAETLGGSICVLYNNLLQRLREDLNIHHTDSKWRIEKNNIHQYSFGEIISAAANNFRHSDEWCKKKEPEAKQKENIRILSSILGLPDRTDGFHPIRKNVCAETLLKISHYSLTNLHQQAFEFAKMLSQHQI